MPPPEVSQAALDLYAILSPVAYADEDLNYPLMNFCEALVGPLQEVNDYVGTNGLTPWSSVVDIDRVPYEALPWFAQLVGSVAFKKLTTETEGDHEQSTPGFYRGSRDAMAAAAQQYLTGSKTVFFNERDTSAYHVTISTKFSETPVEDWPSTNLITNGGFETNTTGWTPVNATIARVVGSAKFGTAYLEITNTATTSSFAIADATISGATAGRQYSVSAYVRGTPSTVGKLVKITASEQGGASGAAGIGVGQLNLSSDWQRITLTGTVVQNDRTSIRMEIEISAVTVGDKFEADGAQIEERSQVTPYIETNGATASRSAGQGPIGIALRAAKPAGITLNYQVIAGQDWNNVIANNASWTAVMAAFTSWDDLGLG
jgi:Carbohydrate binding domain